MIEVNVVDRTGQHHKLHAELDNALMWVLRDNQLSEGACDGNCSCATCHVYVSPDWYAKLPAPNSFESFLLSDSAHYKEAASRLACQIEAKPELNGIELTIAEPD